MFLCIFHICYVFIKIIKCCFGHLKSLYKWYLVVNVPLLLGSLAQNCFWDLFKVDRCSSGASIFKCHMVSHCLSITQFIHSTDGHGFFSFGGTFPSIPYNQLSYACPFRQIYMDSFIDFLKWLSGK